MCEPRQVRGNFKTKSNQIQQHTKGLLNLKNIVWQQVWFDDDHEEVALRQIKKQA